MSELVRSGAPTAALPIADLAIPAPVATDLTLPGLAAGEGPDETETLIATLACLAGVFAEPPVRDAIVSFRSGAASVALDGLFAAAPTGSDLRLGLGTMIEALGTDLDDGDLTGRLGVAYGRLFLGIGGPETVSLYESVHRCGRLFQAPAAEMERLLAAHDLSVGVAGEAADHLSVELTLLAHLVAEGDPDASALAARLAGWIVDFRDLCITFDPTGFFAGAATALVATVERLAKHPAPAV